MPTAARTALNDPVNCGPVTHQEPEASGAFAEVHQEIADLLPGATTHPGWRRSPGCGHNGSQTSSTRCSWCTRSPRPDPLEEFQHGSDRHGPPVNRSAAEAALPMPGRCVYSC